MRTIGRGRNAPARTREEAQSEYALAVLLRLDPVLRSRGNHLYPRVEAALGAVALTLAAGAIALLMGL